MAKKIALITVLVIIASICAMILVACGGGEDADTDEVPDTDEYNVTVAEMTNGTVTASKTKAKAGDEVTVTATPSDNSIFIDGSLKVNDKAIVDGKFIMPECNVTITASFVRYRTNGIGIDNIYSYVKEAKNSNFTYENTQKLSSGTQVDVSKSTIKFTPEMYECINDGSFEYGWIDGDYFYEASGVGDTVNNKTKSSSDMYSVYIHPLYITDEVDSSYFEIDGEKWRIIPSKISEYMTKINCPDNEDYMQLCKNLRIEFKHDSIKISLFAETNGNKVEAEFIIRDIGTTSVTVPESVLNAEETV